MSIIVVILRKWRSHKGIMRVRCQEGSSVAQEKILIVEDEQALSQLMDTMMQTNGYRTVIARDGVEGLDLATRERPDLILLDLHLPKMGGMEVLRGLREQQVNLPVVVVTAWRTERLVIEALRLGVKDYITKPFSMNEMLDVVQRALTEGRLRRERDTLIEQLQGSNQELEQRVRQLTALYEVGQALASTLDLDETLQVILQEAGRVLGVDVASIFLLDEQTGELVFCSGTGEGAKVLIYQRLAPGQGIAGWVAERGDPLLVHDAQSDPRYSPIFDEITGLITSSILCVPLIVKGRVIGVVEALNKPQPGFTEDDLAMLRSLATSAAIAIENAQLFEETRRLHRQTEMQLTQTTQAYSEIQALQEMTGALLSSSLDLQEVLNQIVNSVVSGLGYRGAMLAEYDEQNQSLPVRAFAADPALAAMVEPYEDQVGLRLLESHVTMDQTENLAVRAVLDGKLQVTTDLFDLFRPLVTPEVAEAIQVAAGIYTLAAIPLLTKGRLLGNLFAASSKSQLSESDLGSLQTLANQAALAIENARLYQNLRESRDQVAERSEALEKRLSELSRLQQMAMELGKVTIGADPKDIFEQLTEQAATLLEAESSAIMLLDPERGELVCQEPAFGVPADIIRDWRIPLSEDNPVWAIWESGGPFIVNDVANAPIVKAMGFEEIEERMGLRSTVFCLLRVGGRYVGVLQVSDKRDGSDFTSDDARVLEIFASQSAIAIENVRILQRMEALNQVSEAITAHLTLPEVLEWVMQGINKLIKVEGVSIWLREPTPDDRDDNGNDKQPVYHREPFASDVSEGRHTWIYKAHTYHTKVPPKALVRYILHYTDPGDIILDGFCGTGMVGVAAQMCSSPDDLLKAQINTEMATVAWGERRSILIDLSPVATFIAYNYNMPISGGITAFDKEATRILGKVEAELGWMYETDHTGWLSNERDPAKQINAPKPHSSEKGKIKYTVWSDVFLCPECSGEIVFHDVAFDRENQQVRDKFECPQCRAHVGKRVLDRAWETVHDRLTNTTIQRQKQVPVLISYSIGKKRYVKHVDQKDIELLERVEELTPKGTFPTSELPYMHMSHERNNLPAIGVTHSHHFFTWRNLQAVSLLAKRIAESPLASHLWFWFEANLLKLSKLMCYNADGIGRITKGIIYISSLTQEMSPFHLLRIGLGNYRRFVSEASFINASSSVAIATQSTTDLSAPTRKYDPSLNG
jgi:GAF domain-containing protein/CheY-like chemotaxis protein